MILLKDIAAACGVSVATVSKALNGHNDIGPETRERIRKVADNMGYFPNSAAKALKTNRTYNIGVLFADEAQSGLTHDFFATVLDSFRRTAEAAGFDITFINSSHAQERSLSYLAHSRYRGFDGVCIACVDFYDPDVVDLVRSELPIVTIDHSFDGKISVVSDNVSGMHDLLHYVYEMGHRRIAYIHGLPSAVTQNRLMSFYRTMAELGLAIPDEYIMEAPYRSTSETRDCTFQLLDLPTPPTCIFYPDDFSALGGYSALQQRKLSVPDDISIVGFDGIRLSRHIAPRLTTYRQDMEQMGRVAAERLIELIEHPKDVIQEPILVPGSVYQGESVARIQ